MKMELLNIEYAGFWRRFLAGFLDFIFLYVIGFISGCFLGAALMLAMGTVSAEPVITVIAPFVGLLINWLYFTLFESSCWQATPGKRILRLFVTDMGFQRITFARANGRYWGKAISIMSFYIGFIMAGFTSRKQALHDIMAKTLVMYRVK
jgi:uncharacterized RDD family membrane protein YckC